MRWGTYHELVLGLAGLGGLATYLGGVSLMTLAWVLGTGRAVSWETQLRLLLSGGFG